MSFPAALFVLEAAAARAGVIAAGFGRCLAESGRRFGLPGRQLGERFTGVHEETLEPGTKVVETRLAIGCFYEAVLGTAAVAHGQDFTCPAITRKGAPLCFSETSLRLAIQQLIERRFADVAQEVIEVNKVIARKEIAVVFEYGNLTACFAEYTQ